jgi:hypothetical protein
MYRYNIFLSTTSSGLRFAHEVMLANRDDMSMPAGTYKTAFEVLSYAHIY